MLVEGDNRSMFANNSGIELLASTTMTVTSSDKAQTNGNMGWVTRASSAESVLYQTGEHR